MIYRDERRKFMEYMIAEGVPVDDMLKAAPKAGIGAPLYLLERWRNSFMTQGVPFDEIPAKPRLLNRFMIGADPEFGLLTLPSNKLDKPTYTFAENFGLDTLSAFGCDMAGRQAELRAHPSRFVLDVVASIAETLRWMNKAAGLGKMYWSPAAFVGARDGCGGHIHFGRKRVGREDEVKALDKLFDLLLSAGVLDALGHAARFKATEYGRFGDFRPQKHGYEYRSMPTWLASPWVAFFVLTTAKLVVLHGNVPLAKGNAQQKLTNLIGAYKGLDDDAAIAWRALRVLGFPKWKDENFAPNWGVDIKSLDKLEYKRHYFPQVIDSSAVTQKQIFEYLIHGKAIQAAAPVKTWDVFDLPKDVFKVKVAPHYGGIMDVAAGLVSKGLEVEIQTSRGTTFQIHSPIKLDVDALWESLRKEVPNHYKDKAYFTVTPNIENAKLIIYLPNYIYQNHITDSESCRQFKKWIANPNRLPICLGEELYNVKFKADYSFKPKKIAAKTLLGGKNLQIEGERRPPVRIERVRPNMEQAVAVQQNGRLYGQAARRYGAGQANANQVAPERNRQYIAYDFDGPANPAVNEDF